MSTLSENLELGKANGQHTAAAPRSRALPVIYDNIPAELKSKDQWFVWRYTIRDDNETKPPYNARTGYFGDSTDLSTLSSFAQAQAAYETGRWDGIGFLPLIGDGIVGLDWDHCRNKETEKAEEKAARQIAMMNTYTEISPSGTGFRAFAYGKKPGISCKRRGFEMYDGRTKEGKQGGRYLTVTGHKLPGKPDTINAQQAEIDQLYFAHWPEEKGPDQQKETRADDVREPEPEPKSPESASVPEADFQFEEILDGRHEKPDPKTATDAQLITFGKDVDPQFKLLWEGHWQAATDKAGKLFPSQSEADLSLMNSLAALTGNDKVRMERMFGMSELGKREKWTAPERAYYRNGTIEKATTRKPMNGKSTNDNPEPTDKPHVGQNAARPQTITNFRWVSTGRKNGEKEILARVGLSQQTIRSQIVRAVGNWPKSADGVLFVEGPDHQPLFLENHQQLFAWFAKQLPKNADNKLIWQNSGETMVGRGQYFEFERQNAERFDSVEAYPHFPDPMPGHYYLHPKIVPGNGSHLKDFLDFFCPSSPVDRQLLLACIASTVWGGPCGKRPAWIFTGPDGDKKGGRGVGKTTTAELIASLTGGAISIKDTENCKAETIEKRLLSKEGRRRRILLIDNLKAVKFSWPYIESFITQEIISGVQLYQGEGRRPNNITVIITANGASLSVDMAQRCNVVKLNRPTYSGTWDQDVSDFIAKHRWDIFADLMAFFQ